MLNRTVNKHQNKYDGMFLALKARVEHAVSDFKNGFAVLVGDDGIRENEIDLVFHGEHASPKLVNLALQHGKGLLCVSVGPHIADNLALATAPQYPAQFSHTAFTVSIDAKENVASGISATDRSTTICLMANTTARPIDFVSPGHVFPLRAKAGGLLERTGHTEAALELCRLAEKTEVAAIVEVLNEDGEPVRPGFIQHGPKEIRDLTYVTTVDLLWYQILSNRLWDDEACLSKLSSGNFKFVGGLLSPVSSACVCHIGTERIQPQDIRIQVSNGLKTIANKTNSLRHDIFIFNPDENFEPVVDNIDGFCDLSHKDGLQSTLASVRRVVTLIKTLEHVRKNHSQFARFEWYEKIDFPIADDKVFVGAILNQLKV